MEFKFQMKLAAVGKTRWNIEELTKVNAMVIYQRPDKEKGHRYTCKFFDSKSGNCTNYSNRPRMCSEYPYSKQCAYKACTMENKGCAKIMPVPIEEKLNE